MANFTGMTVVLRLHHQDMMLQGEVTALAAGRALTLQNVLVLSTGQRYPTYTVDASAIADIQVDQQGGPTSSAPPHSATQPGAPRPTQHGWQGTHFIQPPQAPQPPQHGGLPARGANGNPNAPQQPQPSTFVDPAILSYGKSPAAPRMATTSVELPTTPVKSGLAKAAESLPGNSSPFVAEAEGSGSRNVSGSMGKVASVQEPVATTPSQLRLQKQYGGDLDGAQEQSTRPSASKKKARATRPRRANGTNGTNETSQDPPPVMNAEVSRNGNDMNGSARRGKGWRQTPFLQPSPQHSHGFEDNDGAKAGSKRKTRRAKELADELRQDGWATEEANNIQELDDFDFEANHKLFDKKQVFDELRQGDTTAEEELLVSHNRARPGTYGGKNLHPTENVLSPPLAPKQGSADMDSSSDADTEFNLGGRGRSSSKHSASRVSLKKVPSRQNSTMLEGKPVPHPLTTSMTSEHGSNRSRTSFATKNVKGGTSVATASRPDRTRSPKSILSATKTRGSPLPQAQTSEPHLAVRSSAPSTCPVLLPTALEMLEQETTSRYGITTDAITESAARSIAETALTMFDNPLNPSPRRGSRTTTSRSRAPHHPSPDPPVIVVLAGNHTTAARALAAARYLASRNTRLIIAEATADTPDALHPQLRTQTAIFKRLALTGLPLARGPWRKALAQIKNLPAPPAIIIDALLAGDTYESLLQEGSPLAQAEAREMIEWANRSRAPVLSINCPSGVSAVNGAATVVEGEPVAIRPERVLSLGVPLKGLVEGLKAGEGWRVDVADVGIEVALARGEGVGFGASWTVEVALEEGWER